jgi:hypothetical protein
MEESDTSSWAANGGATLSKQTASPYRGARYLRVQSTGGDNASQARQVILTENVRYLIDGWYQTDSGGTVQIWAGGGLSSGLAESSTWVYGSVEMIATAAFPTFFMLGTLGINNYAEFDDWKVRTANPLNGDITTATVGQVAAGNIRYGYSFDGSNDYVDIYSSALNTAFDSDNGAIFAFGKSDTWAAGVDYLMQIGADTNNTVYLSRSATNLILSYTAGATAESVTIASGSPTGYWMAALTWDTTGGGAVKAYYNGVQSGSTQTIAGSWAGVLGSTVCNIGANATTPTNVWAGDVAECGLIVGRTPTDSEIAEIFQRAGI